MSKSLKNLVFNFLNENVDSFENMERKGIMHLLKKKFKAQEETLVRYYSEWKKDYMKPKELKNSDKIDFTIKKDITLKGKFAEYLVNDNGITVGELNFKTLQDVINYEKAEITEFNKRMKELKEAIKFIGAEII